MTDLHNKTKEELIAEVEQLQQTVEQLQEIVTINEDEGTIKANVQGLEILWHPTKGTIKVADLPAMLIWIDSSMAGMMQGFQALAGTDRFGLALHGISREGTEDDWSFISQHESFEDGFAAIRHIAALSGWGDWQLLAFDHDQQQFRVRITDNWEGLYQKALGVDWGSNMIGGKLAGYGTKLFETDCWAEQTASIAVGDPYDEFLIQPSTKTVESELQALIEANKATLADVKRAKEALESANQKINALLEYASASVIVVNGQGVIDKVNRKTEQLFGYERTELVGQPLNLLIPTRYHEAHDVHIQEYISKPYGRMMGEYYSHLAARCKDGQEFPVEINLSYAYEGEEVYTMAYIVDVTEKVQYREKETRLQRELIETQQRIIAELSTPIIPVMDGIIILPLIGTIDSNRAEILLRTMLNGISQHRAKIVILEITGVSTIDTDVAGYLDKTIQAARLKGAQTILTGISDSVAETIIDLGINWSNIETVRDLQTGLAIAWQRLGVGLE